MKCLFLDIEGWKFQDALVDVMNLEVMIEWCRMMIFKRLGNLSQVLGCRNSIFSYGYNCRVIGSS